MTATAAVLRETAPRAVARTAGIGYLVIIVSGIFAEFFARGSLIVAGDAVATATYAATLLTLYAPLLILDGAGPLGALLTAESQALLLLSLELHATGYAIALLFFGVHCLAVGFVIVRSGIVPRAVGGLLAIAGAGYLFDSFARTLLVNYGAMEPVFAVVVFAPALIGELTFCCWLLFKGVRPVSVG